MPDEILRHVPAPLLRQLVEGRWLPIVGAGFSRNATVPSGSPPPDWKGLGDSLASDLPDVEHDGPLDAISAYEQVYGRSDLVDRLSALLRIADAQPSDTHRAFARLGFQNVLTTNFDLLLDKAYESVQRSCLPLVEESQLTHRNVYAGPRLIKFHGDVHHPHRLVLTEEDYDHFLLKYPLLATNISALLINHTGILIGYSLDDPDMRQILATVRERLGHLSPPLWAIQVGAPAHLVSRYERRGVKVINLPKRRDRTYAQQLTELFEVLRRHWQDELLDESRSTDESALADLSLPADSSQICYFAVPLDLLSWYRDAVFPLVRKWGFVPVAARDVLTPPGTTTTKIDALIGRAALVVLELSGSNMAYELSLAVQKHRPASLVLVTADREPGIARDVELLRIIRRPPDLSSAIDSFLIEFDSWLSERVQGRDGVSRLSEPERLLNMREYKAAVVAAVSLLEITLSRAYDFQPKTSNRMATLPELLRSPTVQENLLPAEFEILENARRLRNETLHLGREVTASEARPIVSTISAIAQRIGLSS